MIKSYRDLIVWQKAVYLSVKVYELTENFPRDEIYGLTSQMRRSSVSIASNIAEGRGRGTRKDFTQFLRIAFGSCSELQTQIEIAKQLSRTKGLTYTEVESVVMEITKMLNSIITKLQIPKPNS